MTTRPSVLALGARMFGLLILVGHIPEMVYNMAYGWMFGLGETMACVYAIMVVVLARKFDRFAPPDTLPAPRALAENARRLLGLFMVVGYLPSLLAIPIILGQFVMLRSGVVDEIMTTGTTWNYLGMACYPVVLLLAGTVLLILPLRKRTATEQDIDLVPTTESAPAIAVAEQYVCGECNAVVKEDDTICPACGANITDVELFYCSACGKEITEDAQRCPHCGK